MRQVRQAIIIAVLFGATTSASAEDKTKPGLELIEEEEEDGVRVFSTPLSAWCVNNGTNKDWCAHTSRKDCQSFGRATCRRETAAACFLLKDRLTSAKSLLCFSSLGQCALVNEDILSTDDFSSLSECVILRQRKDKANAKPRSTESARTHRN